MSSTPAKKDKTEVGAPIDYSKYAGAGRENATQDDYAIPYIYIVQKNGRMIDENPDAKPGMIYNNVTGQLYSELLAIPCHFIKEWTEWTPHDEGGGFHGSYPFDESVVAECVQNDKGKWVTPEGHEMIDSRKHYCLFISRETGEVFPGIIAMASTQAKKSRRWLSTIANSEIELADGRKIPAPSFAFQYLMTTVKEQKDSNTWFGWAITKGDKVEDESLFTRAAELYEAAKKNDIQEAAPDQQ